MDVYDCNYGRQLRNPRKVPGIAKSHFSSSDYSDQGCLVSRVSKDTSSTQREASLLLVWIFLLSGDVQTLSRTLLFE